MKTLTITDIQCAVRSLIGAIPLYTGTVWGVPRGGVPIAFLIALNDKRFTLCDDPADADIIVDDIRDSGATLSRYKLEYPNVIVAAAYTRERIGIYGEQSNDWLVFPWETNETPADDAVTRLIQLAGDDPKREGLRETPKRFVEAWQHWTQGYEQEPADVLKTFDDGAEHYDEMVLVKNIPIYSHCEHHLAPFFGNAHIAYIPQGRIVGLSKLTRVANILSRRLQVQERLTAQIANAIHEALSPRGVAVVLECRHMCMESRGISAQGEITTTSAMLGTFKADAACRAEFFSLVK